MSGDVIYTKGFDDGYHRALEDDLREVKRFAAMGKSAQDVAELLEYLITKNSDSPGTGATPAYPHA